MYSKRLLFSNKVDCSLFNEGISLPNKLNSIFGKTEYGCMLREGKIKGITIYLDGNIYYAKIINTNYSNEIKLNSLKIIYSENSDLYNKFKTLYKSSYKSYLFKRKRKKYLFTRPSEEKKEYISIYAIKDIYTTKHLGIFYIEASYEKDPSNLSIIEKNQINEYVRSLGDIQELIYDMNGDQHKRNNWISYIISFHEIWKKRDKNNLLNGKHIWGKKILVDPNKKIVDIFNRNIYSNIVQFFHMKNKSFIKEIGEVDLIQLIYSKDFEFIDFKRLINNLFVKNRKAEKTEMDSDKIIDLEKDNDFSVVEKVNGSINKIKNELDIFKDVIKDYDITITELNSIINLQNKEITMLKNTIKELEEINESRQHIEELEDIKKNLKEIKSLLEKDSIL